MQVPNGCSPPDPNRGGRQDYAKLLGTAHKVGFTTFDRWIGYTPCKNNPEAGAVLAGKNMPAMTVTPNPHPNPQPLNPAPQLHAKATSSEMEYYAANAKLLELAGMEVGQAATQILNQVSPPTSPVGQCMTRYSATRWRPRSRHGWSSGRPSCLRSRRSRGESRVARSPSAPP